MAAVVFPTYFLARLLVGRPWALFAAAAAGTIPSLAYSSWLVEETIAYPYAALCFLLIVKALVTRARWWVVGAVLASLVAPAVRGELVVIPITAFFACLFAYWGSDRAKTRRASWTTGDWLGFFAIVAGVIIAVSGYLTWHVDQWQKVTSYNWTKKRIFLYGDWAAGALAIGIGVVPLVAGIAALFRAPGERPSRNVRMFRCTAAAGIISFGVYTAMKAAYLSMTFETRVEERNLIYIAPLLFIGTALVLERRRVNFAALAVAAAYGFYLVVGTPFKMDRGLYSDALGLAIFQQANRYFEWTPYTAQWVLLAVFAVGLVLIVATSLRRVPRQLAVGGTAILAVGLLAWNVTGEISAAAGTTSISRDSAALLGRPFTWVDDVAHGKPTLYFAQGVVDQRPEWLLEFWNRSISAVTSLDNSVLGPGPSGAPNVTATGQLYWTHDPAQPGKLFDYAVEDWPCVDFAGTFAKTARLPHRPERESVAPRPAHEAQPPAGSVQRDLPGRLERPQRQLVLPVLRHETGLAAHLAFTAELAAEPGDDSARDDRCATPLPGPPARHEGAALYAGEQAASGEMAARPRLRLCGTGRHRAQVHPPRLEPRHRRSTDTRRTHGLPFLHEAAEGREAEQMSVKR